MINLKTLTFQQVEIIKKNIKKLLNYINIKKLLKMTKHITTLLKLFLRVSSASSLLARDYKEIGHF